MDVLNAIVQWVVAPIAGFVWLLHSRVQQQSTEIAVLKAVVETTKLAYDREFKEIREGFKTVFTKLDSIEQALRK